MRNVIKCKRSESNQDKEVKQFYAHDLTLQFCAPALGKESRPPKVVIFFIRSFGFLSPQAPVFLAQKDPQNWTEALCTAGALDWRVPFQVPIMYQNITYPENEADSKCALEQMRLGRPSLRPIKRRQSCRKILYNALNYAEIS